ncbi:MAG: hypothetical protein RR348_04555, partial [Clostridia bacterium]
MIRIIFVCTGNTCRSPLAEGLMKDKLKKLDINKVTVLSAGIAIVAGSTISENTAKILDAKNIEYSREPKSVAQIEFFASDIIITMTKYHEVMMKKLYPNAQIYCVSDFSNTGAVEDPYGQDIEAYQNVANQLDKAID